MHDAEAVFPAVHCDLVSKRNHALDAGRRTVQHAEFKAYGFFRIEPGLWHPRVVLGRLTIPVIRSSKRIKLRGSVLIGVRGMKRLVTGAL